MKHHETIAADEYRFRIIIDPAEEGGFMVTCPTLRGMVAEGETLKEARAMAANATDGYLEPESDEPLSKPITEEVTVSVARKWVGSFRTSGSAEPKAASDCVGAPTAEANRKTIPCASRRQTMRAVILGVTMNIFFACNVVAQTDPYVYEADELLKEEDVLDELKSYFAKGDGDDQIFPASVVGIVQDGKNASIYFMEGQMPRDVPKILYTGGFGRVNCSYTNTKNWICFKTDPAFGIIQSVFTISK